MSILGHALRFYLHAYVSFIAIYYKIEHVMFIIN